MAGSTASVPCEKSCVCGPFHKAGKINFPLWWYGEQGILYNFAGGNATPTNCTFINYGYYFNGGNSYLIDEQGRKILREGTTGLWSSINLDCSAPSCGSITGSGTVLKINNGSTLPPKIGGSLILYPQRCPSLTRLECYNNSISVLDVSALTSLTALDCYVNSISVLDVSALTSLRYLYCNNNSISVLDVSALTYLVELGCNNNSISVLDVSVLTSLGRLNCNDNSISVLDVSVLTSLTALYCNSNSMNQAMVDTVLCDMDGHGTNNGNLAIAGNAVPSATGITCKNNLLGRGWTVTTD